LKSITIPASVNTIEYDALKGGFKTIEFKGDLPASIDNNAISSTTYIIVPDEYKANYRTKYGAQVVDKTSNGLFIMSTGTCGTGINWQLVSDGTLTISGNGDMDCSGDPWSTLKSSIKKVVIENGITNIDNSAFKNCTSLQSVTIPGSVTTIGVAAFKNCTSLTGVIIPDSVTNIYGNAFENCSSLTSITIPGSVTNIAGDSFNGCSNLETVEFKGLNPSIYAGSIPNTVKKIIVPDAYKELYKTAFGSSFESKIIDASTYAASKRTSSNNTKSSHTHNLSWMTTTEPTVNHDGEASLVCSECGYVESTQTISRSGVVYMSYANKFEKMLTTSKQGDTIKIDLGDWHSVPKYLMERIIVAPNDVELTYKYKGETFDIVIPKGKGIDLKINWYGPLLMKSIYGSK